MLHYSKPPPILALMFKNHVWLEYLGVSASALCLIHCSVLPLIVFIYPMTRLQESHGLFEGIMVALILISGLTFWRGFKYHGSKTSLFAAYAGMTLLILSLLLEATLLSLPLSILGSSLMLFAHYFNHKLCKCSHKKH